MIVFFLMMRNYKGCFQLAVLMETFMETFFRYIVVLSAATQIGISTKCFANKYRWITYFDFLPVVSYWGGVFHWGGRILIHLFHRISHSIHSTFTIDYIIHGVDYLGPGGFQEWWKREIHEQKSGSRFAIKIPWHQQSTSLHLIKWKSSWHLDIFFTKDPPRQMKIF